MDFKTHKCNFCFKTKKRLDFVQSKSYKKGFTNRCRDCQKIVNEKYRKSRGKGNVGGTLYRKLFEERPSPELLTRILMTGICNKVRRGGCYTTIERRITKSELKSFVEENWDKYMQLRAVWIESGREPKLIPTIDRIDGDKHYELGNLQFLTLSDNVRKIRRHSKIN